MVYSYLLYPLVLLIISVWAPRPEVPSTPEVLPRIAVLIAAYNEEACIRARIENLLSLNSPGLQIVVGDDGSRDDTANILKSISSDQLHCEFFSSNRGKSAVLNDLVASSDAEVLVFTDANTKFQADALVHLVFGHLLQGQMHGNNVLACTQGWTRWRREIFVSGFHVP